MKPTTILVFSCILLWNAVHSQSQRSIEEFNEVSIDSCVSWMVENFQNVDIFHEVALNTLKRAQSAPDSIRYKVHRELGVWHAYNGLFSPDSVVYHNKKVLDYYLNKDNETQVAYTYELLARNYIKSRDLTSAQDVLFKAITIHEKLDNDEGLGMAYRTLGVLYQVMEDYEKSLEYTYLSLPLLENSKNYGLLGMAHFNLIIGHGELNEFEKAYEATENCLKIVEDKVPEEVFIPVKAHSYRGEVYERANDYDNALKDYIRSWELCVDIIGEERCATYRTEIGQIYLLQQEYEKALDHLKAGIDSYEEQGKFSIIQQYENLSKCYAELGDHENALIYLKKANTNSKKVLEDKVANLETELAVKYETGKKDEAIAAQGILLEQKTKVQTLVIAIASLLGVILVIMIVFFNKNKKKSAIINAKNQENELLLKEIHHRVKNNLELVKSLIAPQSAEITDSKTKEAMLASQNRVQSMGIIHQKLYQGYNLGSIDMKDYFINLSHGILDSFNPEDKVKTECAMEQLELDVDTAVPIGLIVNELLTNALKYAFPEQQKGKIEISLSQPNSKTLQLVVSDNGIGKQEHNPVKGTGFGTQLINLLTKQLNEIMEENYHNGTSVSFQFKT
ncbi:MAG: tetratricopeptide repeat protein [Psychroserpens sp.]|nr:tetratricopeptide repeat protein [Psychroserpens sp.]